MPHAAEPGWTGTKNNFKIGREIELEKLPSPVVEFR